MNSSEFSWNDDAEVFRFLAASFDVQKAKEFIRNNPRPVFDMDIAGVESLVGSPPHEGQTVFSMGVRVDWSKVQSDSVDLDVPVVLCELNGDYMPIDGWHRIAKAKLKGVAKIRCVVLSSAESKEVTHLPGRGAFGPNTPNKKPRKARKPRAKSQNA